MILQSLVDQYDRLVAQDKVPLFGKTREKIGFAIVLDTKGEIVDIEKIRDATDEKSRWQSLTVPASFKRSGTKALPYFLWDKCAFLLGVEQKNEKDSPTLNLRGHAAFKSLHVDRLSEVSEPGLTAVKNFIEMWNPAKWNECEHITRHVPDIFSREYCFSVRSNKPLRP